MVREKERCAEEKTHHDDLPVRNRVEQYLPPVDVAFKIYLVDAVSVRDNTFMSVFNVLLDWEDPSL